MVNRITLQPDPVQPGGILTICYTNEDRDGETIEIALHNGSAFTPRNDVVSITVGSAGGPPPAMGCTTWVVPEDWGDFVIAEFPADSDLATVLVDV